MAPCTSGTAASIRARALLLGPPCVRHQRGRIGVEIGTAVSKYNMFMTITKYRY